MLNLLRWSFSYIKWGVLIWLWLNQRNFNPRNFHFLVGLSFKTIFAPSPTTTTFISKDAEFSCASCYVCEKFAASFLLPKRPRKWQKVDFRSSVPRKLGQDWYHLNWFLNLFNLNFLDSNFIAEFKNPKNPRIQPIHDPLSLTQLDIILFIGRWFILKSFVNSHTK